jgi:hypothetical protein
MTYCTYHRLPENHDCAAFADHDGPKASDGADLNAVPDYTESPPARGATEASTQPGPSADANPWLAYLTVIGVLVFVIIVLALTAGWV